MHLKGVWLPVKRAYNLARDYGILNIVYPLFQNHLSKGSSGGNSTQKLSNPSCNFGSLASPQTPRMLESGGSCQTNVTYFPLSSASSSSSCQPHSMQRAHQQQQSMSTSLQHARMLSSNNSSSCSIVSPVSTYEPTTDPSYPFQWQNVNTNFEDFFCTKTGLFHDPSSSSSNTHSSSVKSSLQPALSMTNSLKKSMNEVSRHESSLETCTPSQSDSTHEASNICADIDLFFNAPNDEEEWYIL